MLKLYNILDDELYFPDTEKDGHNHSKFPIEHYTLDYQVSMNIP